MSHFPGPLLEEGHASQQTSHARLRREITSAARTTRLEALGAMSRLTRSNGGKVVRRVVCVLLLHFFPPPFLRCCHGYFLLDPRGRSPFPLVRLCKAEAPAGRQEGHRNPQGLKSSKLVATRRFSLGIRCLHGRGQCRAVINLLMRIKLPAGVHFSRKNESECTSSLRNNAVLQAKPN